MSGKGYTTKKPKAQPKHSLPSILQSPDKVSETSTPQPTLPLAANENTTGRGLLLYGVLEDENAEDEYPEENALVSFDLSLQDCAELLAMSVEEMERFIQQKFNLKAETNLSDAALLDYFVSAIYWAKQQKYTAQHLYGFYTIVHTLLVRMFQEQSSFLDLLQEFHQIVSEISAGSKCKTEYLQCFDTEQGKAMIEYFQYGLFQHLKLFRFLFSGKQPVQTITAEVAIELPQSDEVTARSSKIRLTLPLEEAMPENLVKYMMDIPTPSSPESLVESLDQMPSIADVGLTDKLENVFSKLTPDDVKNIIKQVTTSVMASLQTDMETKIKTQESSMLNKINCKVGEPPK